MTKQLSEREAAEKWRQLVDALRAKGWQNVTPPLVAGIVPELRRHTGRHIHEQLEEDRDSSSPAPGHNRPA